MSYSGYISELNACTLNGLDSQKKSSLLRLIELSNRSEGIQSYLWFRKQSPEDEGVISALVDHNLIEVGHGNRLRRGGRNYLLTTCGLFYILTENQIFSGVMLSKYSENIILQLLLFQYFQEDTIKNWSPQAQSIISDYLHKCCVTSKRTIETVRSLRIPKDTEVSLKTLELVLKDFAYCLGIRMTRLYFQYLGISKNENLEHPTNLSHHGNKMLRLLSADIKFSRFKSNIIKEFNESFRELTSLRAE